ncbi:hypothetical protein KsCSTR_02770 [Candidatus Kuenenia stuttgartiensis]|uniref:Uncharacterized protein n=1 Tax=Kuenenia stuttgartiensis TaxID=174633 RepID=Q1PY48_KUEST|nr:hypothetical protein KsCSTR_02770 [Candidatus Kuenenia stuttgartiensis]CAJ72954.1 unknown protein [Candidatus Kuenenia stuttgartiensis]
MYEKQRYCHDLSHWYRHFDITICCITGYISCLLKYKFIGTLLINNQKPLRKIRRVLFFK